MSASWIAVIGRQKPNSNLESHEVITPSATLMATAANSRALSLMSSWCRAARSRSEELTSGMVLPAMNSAVAVCSGVRTVLVAEPTAFTSLKSSVYVWDVSAGGGPGRNWLGESSSSGRIWAIHGSKNGANAGGVGRQTPGAGGTSKVTGAKRPSSSRSSMSRSAARSP